MSDYYPIVLGTAHLLEQPRVIASQAQPPLQARNANEVVAKRSSVNPTNKSSLFASIALLLAAIVLVGILCLGWGGWFMQFGCITGGLGMIAVIALVRSLHSAASLPAALSPVPTDLELCPIEPIEPFDTRQVRMPNRTQGEMQAQQGVSEQAFLVHLLQWFPQPDFLVCGGLEFAIPGTSRSYCADFVVYHRASGLAFDIECDEPYEGKSQAPIHCTGDRKEERRNQFFLRGNWIVVRLAESQIVRSPLSCCKLIAAIVARLSGDDRVLRSLWGVPNLERVKRWSAKDAQRMAKSQYRLSYLNSNGATFTPPARSQSAPQRQLSRSRRIQR